MTAPISPLSLPSDAGSYILFLRLSDPLPLKVGSLPEDFLAPGTYAYAGSARGPGGVRARVARHLRSVKKAHWHIDRLTEAAPIVEVLSFPDRSECDLVTKLLTRPDARIPILGFGSSDCRRCAAHLVALG